MQCSNTNTNFKYKKISSLILCMFVFNTVNTSVSFGQGVNRKRASNANFRVGVPATNTVVNNTVAAEEVNVATTEDVTVSEPVVEVATGVIATTTTTTAPQDAAQKAAADRAKRLQAEAAAREVAQYNSTISSLKTELTSTIDDAKTACSAINSEMKSMMGLATGTVVLATTAAAASGLALYAGLKKAKLDDDRKPDDNERDAGIAYQENLQNIKNQKQAIETAEGRLKNLKKELPNSQNALNNRINELESVENTYNSLEAQRSSVSADSNEYAILTQQMNDVYGGNNDADNNRRAAQNNLNYLKKGAEHYNRYENDQRDYGASTDGVTQENLELVGTFGAAVKGQDTLDKRVEREQATINLMKGDEEGYINGLAGLQGATKDLSAAFSGSGGDGLTQSKNLGNMRTIALAGAAASHIGGIATSAMNIGKAPKVLEAMENCNAAIEKVRFATSELEVEVSSTDSSSNSIIAYASTISSTCSGFDINNMTTVKNLAIGSTVTSSLGAVSAISGTVTSAMANSNNVRTAQYAKDADVEKAQNKEKNLNFVSNILAGVSLGAAAGSLALGVAQIAVLNKDFEQAELCAEILLNYTY